MSSTFAKIFSKNFLEERRRMGGNPFLFYISLLGKGAITCCFLFIYYFSKAGARGNLFRAGLARFVTQTDMLFTEKEGERMAHAGGRPPTYRTPEEMQTVIDEYFKSCEGHVLTNDDGEAILDKYGQPFIVGARPPTVTGLALALGFATRKSLLEYQAKRKFVNTVARAKSRIEEYAEGRLFDRDGQRGAEFSLRYNFRWVADEKEEQQEDATGVVLMPEVTDSE